MKITRRRVTHKDIRGASLRKLDNWAGKMKLRQRWAPSQGTKLGQRGRTRMAQRQNQTSSNERLIALSFVKCIDPHPIPCTQCLYNIIQDDGTGCTCHVERETFTNGVNTVTRSSGKLVTHSVNPGQLSYQTDLRVPSFFFLLYFWPRLQHVEVFPGAERLNSLCCRHIFALATRKHSYT